MKCEEGSARFATVTNHGRAAKELIATRSDRLQQTYTLGTIDPDETREFLLANELVVQAWAPQQPPALRESEGGKTNSVGTHPRPIELEVRYSCR